jgi:hypothetical protein
MERHNIGKKHIDIVKELGFYPCIHCGRLFNTSKQKCGHENKCKEKENYLARQEKKVSKKTKDSDITMAMKVAQTAVETSYEHAKTAGKSMNMMKYAMVHFKDAPPLFTLDQNQVHQMLEYDQKNTDKPKDEINSDYIMPVLYNYENKVLDEFFGKFIVNYFNTEEMKDRKFWTSDMSRLSFIIMQVVNRLGEREWNHDKSGKKFIDLVIDPMFDEVVKLLEEFVNNKQKWIDENFGKVYIAPSKMTHLMHVQQLARELQLDIKYSKFTKDILKYVAPHFNFDTVRLAKELKKLNNTNTFSNELEKSVKKVTKVIKKM